MIDRRNIEVLAARIAREYDPERIILFGSYAYGMPRAVSDVDLLVILPFEGNHTQKAIEIRRCVAASFPLDLLARTPEQVRWRVEQGDFFLRDILQKGEVLYESPHHRVGSQKRACLVARTTAAPTNSVPCLATLRPSMMKVPSSASSNVSSTRHGAHGARPRRPKGFAR